MKTTTNAFFSSFLLLNIAACGPTPSLAPANPEALAGQASAPLASTTTDVTWVHRDHIGRGLESEIQVDGEVSISLVGNPHQAKAWFGIVTLQSAIVTIDAPTLLDPNVSEQRTFLARLIQSTQPDGSTAYTSSFGVVVDASVANAQAIFDDTFDTSTQVLDDLLLAPEDAGATFSSVYLGFVREAGQSDLKPISDGNSQLWLGVSKLVDFAHHTYMIRLQ